MVTNRRPMVSVVIPCRNEKENIESCIRSIGAQQLSVGSLEVIVADGISDDGTREILKRLATEDTRLRIIDNMGFIVSTGLNEAIKVALGTVIIRIDAHTEYAQDYIQQCVTVLQETGADNVGGPWVARGNRFMSQAIAAAFQSSFAIGGARGHNENYEGKVDTVYLGCWPREVFDRIGLFDEELVRNQDDEFNLRLTRAGGKIWQSPRIKSWYQPRGSLCALFRQYLQYGYWKVRVIQKHKAVASVRHLIPGGFLLSMLILLLAALWWPTAIWIWLGIFGIYSICTICASALTAAQSKWELFAVLPFVFACYHLAYGCGFLLGILNFSIFRCAPNQIFTKLTRRSMTD